MKGLCLVKIKSLLDFPDLLFDVYSTLVVLILFYFVGTRVSLSFFNNRFFS